MGRQLTRALGHLTLSNAALDRLADSSEKLATAMLAADWPSGLFGLTPPPPVCVLHFLKMGRQLNKALEHLTLSNAALDRRGDSSDKLAAATLSAVWPLGLFGATPPPVCVLHFLKMGRQLTKALETPNPQQCCFGQACRLLREACGSNACCRLALRAVCGKPHPCVYECIPLVDARMKSLALPHCCG